MEYFIKSLKRTRRGESQAYILRGSSTKLPREWKSFLKNDENKKQFIQFLLHEWQQDTSAQLLLNRKVIFACEKQCFVLSTADGDTIDARLLQNLSSSHEEALFVWLVGWFLTSSSTTRLYRGRAPRQSVCHEEADTLLILHSVYVDQTTNSPDTDILIRSPDTGVFLPLIAFCPKHTHPLYFDTGTENKRNMINDIQTLCQKIERDIQDAILGLHEFTSCELNSTFV